MQTWQQLELSALANEPEKKQPPGLHLSWSFSGQGKAIVQASHPHPHKPPASIVTKEMLEGTLLVWPKLGGGPSLGLRRLPSVEIITKFVHLYFGRLLSTGGNHGRLPMGTGLLSRNESSDCQ